MKSNRINDVNIVSKKLLPTPEDIKKLLPVTPAVKKMIYSFREQIKNILDRKDSRLFAVVGPCSIHSINSALEYARRLKALSDEVEDTMILIMRVYFEKPRTSMGWKGFINDPNMDDSFHIDEGLYRAREFLLKLAGMGLPAGTEALDPITPQYIGDLISWTAIGARTTESQTHREMASGLSTPVGFKNATDGSIETAINALKSALQSQHFLGITERGACAVFHTCGNRYGHVVLRGGAKPNYDSLNIARCEKALSAAGLPKNIAVDCSHGNSQRKPERQSLVLDNLVRQIITGNRSIVGFMVESNMAGGPECSVSHWGGVGDEGESRGRKGRESQSNQDRSGNRHRGAETRCPFEESPETESDQQQLQTLIRGDAGEALSQDRKMPLLDCHIIQKDQVENNPTYGEKPKGRPVHGCSEGHLAWHMEEQDRYYKSREQA